MKLSSTVVIARRRWAIIALSLSSMFAMVWLLLANVQFVNTGDHEGFYVLKGGKKLLTITDDIFLGDQGKIILKIHFEPLFDFFRSRKLSGASPPYLYFEWNKKGGRGYVVNYLPEGKKLLTCFGRYREDTGEVPSGLFVGGGLPYNERGKPEVTMNNTGMSYFDGKEWHHIWCSVNELISPGTDPKNHLYPHDWQYLGSEVLKSTPKELVLKSSHLVYIDDIPLRIDRFAFFKAGESYFTLVVKATNVGKAILRYFYVYGDEPWVGDYGSAAGDVGWVKDRIILYEGLIDSSAYTYAGLYDIGNCLINEGHAYTGLANFIEWEGGNNPEFVYFANKVGFPKRIEDKIPLSSPYSRGIYIQWGPRFLFPGESGTHILALGMAQVGSVSGTPIKPPTGLNTAELALLR